MIRDLAALARTLEALRALHVCPTCSGSGDFRDDEDDVMIVCRECNGSGIARVRASDDVVSQMASAVGVVQGLLDADVPALVARVTALEADHAKLVSRYADDYSAVELVVRDLRDRVSALEASVAGPPGGAS